MNAPRFFPLADWHEYPASELVRRAGELPFLPWVVGYPADGAVVPDLARKSLNEIATFV